MTGSFNRLLVALDPSPSSEILLEEAAELASSLGAELTGIFVEDVNLVSAARFSFVHSVSEESGDERHIDAVSVERVLRSQAASLQRRFDDTIRRHRLHGKFRVVRDQIHRALLASAADADLIVVGRAARTPARRVAPGSNALRIAREANRTVILVPARLEPAPRFVVLHDGTDLGQRALETALALRGLRHRQLLVLAAPPEAATLPELIERIDQRLATQKVGWQRRNLIAPSINDLLRALGSDQVSVLVLPASHHFCGGELGSLVTAHPGPVVLVRNHD